MTFFEGQASKYTPPSTISSSEVTFLYFIVAEPGTGTTLLMVQVRVAAAEVSTLLFTPTAVMV